MPDVQNPVAQPLGGPTIAGTQITVDVLTNPPSRIPQVIRDLVADNQGYFIERVFNTPGFTVQGGAIIYTDSMPDDHFLDPTESIAPRAPGAEAPRIGSLRRPPKVARPESWSGSIEVTDEARRRNDVIAVQKEFRAAANTFADRLQTSGMATLSSAVTAWARTIVSPINWRAALAAGVPNADPANLPHTDFGRVLKQFIADKTGVRPDTLIIHQDDMHDLDRIYTMVGGVQSVLDRYDLTAVVTPLAPVGAPYFVKARQVGDMAFEKPLDQETTREGIRKTDVFTLETVPVFVAHDASAIIQLTGVDS